jgi:hypothetical protein
MYFIWFCRAVVTTAPLTDTPTGRFATTEASTFTEYLM